MAHILVIDDVNSKWLNYLVILLTFFYHILSYFVIFYHIVSYFIVY